MAIYYFHAARWSQEVLFLVLQLEEKGSCSDSLSRLEISGWRNRRQPSSRSTAQRIKASVKVVGSSSNNHRFRASVLPRTSGFRD